TTDWLPQRRSACRLSLCIGKVASTKVTLRNARNILRARGANAISKLDYDDISRGKRCFHDHDLHARAQQAGHWREKSAGLIDVSLSNRHFAADAEGAAGDF